MRQLIISMLSTILLLSSIQSMAGSASDFAYQQKSEYCIRKSSFQATVAHFAYMEGASKDLLYMQAEQLFNNTSADPAGRWLQWSYDQIEATLADSRWSAFYGNNPQLTTEQERFEHNKLVVECMKAELSENEKELINNPMTPNN